MQTPLSISNKGHLQSLLNLDLFRNKHILEDAFPTLTFSTWRGCDFFCGYKHLRLHLFCVSLFVLLELDLSVGVGSLVTSFGLCRLHMSPMPPQIHSLSTLQWVRLRNVIMSLYANSMLCSAPACQHIDAATAGTHLARVHQILNAQPRPNRLLRRAREDNHVDAGPAPTQCQ